MRRSVKVLIGLAIAGAALASVPEPPRVPPAAEGPDGLEGMRAKVARDVEIERMAANYETARNAMRAEARRRDTR